MSIDTVNIAAIDSRRGFAMVCMVISSVVISFSGLLIRNIDDADPLQINFYRSIGLIAAVVVFLVIRYKKDTATIITKIGKLGFLGGALLGAAGISFLQAISSTTVANTLFILGAIPFFAALLARIVLKEKISKATLLTMIVAGLGLVVMVREGISIGAGYGNLMALLTAGFFALYAVIVRGKRQTDMIPTLLVSSVIIIIVSVVGKAGDFNVSWHDILLCLFWGAALSGIANFLFIYASRHLAAAEVTLFMLLEFALGPIWVWWFVNEIPSMWTVVGGLLIIFAVAIRAVFEIGNNTGRNSSVTGPV